MLWKRSPKRKQKSPLLFVINPPKWNLRRIEWKIQTLSPINKLGRRPNSSGGGINEPEPRRFDGPDSDDVLAGGTLFGAAPVATAAAATGGLSDAGFYGIFSITSF